MDGKYQIEEKHVTNDIIDSLALEDFKVTIVTGMKRTNIRQHLNDFC